MISLHIVTSLPLLWMLLPLSTGFLLERTCIKGSKNACGRKPARPTATTTTTTQATTEVTTIYTERWLNCSSEEIQKTGCLNGGRCFAMLLGGTRVSACQCPASYTGRRCQEINYLPARSNNRLRTAGIAAGISSLLLILVFGVCVFVIFIRRKRKSVPNGQQRVTQGCPIFINLKEGK